jgi:hypothetical protein
MEKKFNQIISKKENLRKRSTKLTNCTISSLEERLNNKSKSFNTNETLKNQTTLDKND